jgi:A/G-specific adenine glycosylase
LMDLGALVCTRRRPCCGACPVAADCIARIEDRTAELPSPRPRKPLPSRVVGVLVLESASGLLLERRPPTGVWAGLWSLPEFAPEHDARHHCRERFGLDTRAREPLAPIEHAFTHFRLTLKPQRMAVVAGECAREPGLRWFSRSGALEAGLPAPIRALIAALPETQAPLGRSNAAPV